MKALFGIVSAMVFAMPVFSQQHLWLLSDCPASCEYVVYIMADGITHQYLLPQYIEQTGIIDFPPEVGSVAVKLPGACAGMDPQPFPIGNAIIDENLAPCSWCVYGTHLFMPNFQFGFNPEKNQWEGKLTCKALY
ncbi:MAG: hypothetical protein JST38_05600 [Bacteroidetes bacterium]|nr:hypothetical protein [Bacteroidota bacterium]MBS1940334.1 hypothetical protein [Bacteroidota bacterium]